MTAISTVAARILVIKQRNIEPAQHTLLLEVKSKYQSKKLLKTLDRTDSHIHLFHWDFPVEPYEQPV